MVINAIINIPLRRLSQIVMLFNLSLFSL
uniref:Uncharacterized protein n=1 Tax=Rhizophora mucronata TaxID=61149 RepID=A0A2P2NUA5_RHIMU